MNSDDPDVKFPAPSSGDHFHLTARAGIAAIPFFGGPALEVFNAVLAPPIERRRNAWMAEVADTLNILQKKFDVLPETLARSEAFVTFLLNASQVAIRTHEAEKLTALRNAVLNAALDTSPHGTKQHLFLRLIDDLAAAQISALLMKGATSESAAYFFGRERYKHSEWLARELIEDLGRRGLAKVSGLEWPRGGRGGSADLSTSPGGGVPNKPPVVSYERTELGDEFAAFITEVDGEPGA